MMCGLFQYMCKELFVMDFSFEKSKENVYIYLFLLASGEDQNFKCLQSFHGNLGQVIEMPVK